MRLNRRQTSTRAAAVLIALAPGLLATSSLAQSSSPGTFAESVQVDLVTVEVWVSDSEGKPVTGLSREDFSVLHDGVPVEMTHFAEIRDGKRLPAPPGKIFTPHDDSVEFLWERAHLIVVFDVPHLTVQSQRRLAREMVSFLSDSPVPAEQILLLRLEDGLSVEAPFGSTAEELAHALEKLGTRDPSSTDFAADVRQVTQALQGVWTELNDPARSSSLRSIVNQMTGPTASQGAIAGDSGSGGGTAGSAGGAPGLACDDFVDRVQPIIDMWGRREVASTRSSLSRLSDASVFLSGLDGPKTMLYLSDGIAAAPGIAATSFVRGLCPAFKTDLEMDALPEEVDRLFDEVTRRASSNRITVHAVQGQGLEGAAGLVAGQSSSDARGLRLFDRTLRSNAREGLSRLSEPTGGRVVSAGSKQQRQFELVAADIRGYYSLAYTPPPGADGLAHRIEIEARGGSLTARHRSGYRDSPPDELLTERLESALYLGLVDNPLAIRLAAGDVTASSEGMRSLPLHVIVPADRLTFTPEDERATSRVRIKVMALDTETRTLAVTDRDLILPEPEESAGEMIDLLVDLELASGNYLLAVAIRDDTSGGTSVVSTGLQLRP